jgi:fatty-acyl-CoA synthase
MQSKRADSPNSLSFAVGDCSQPVLEQTVGDALRAAAQRWGERTALIDGCPDSQRRWSFTGLLHDAEQVAHALLARFVPGEHVAICAANSPEWVIIEFAAALAGIVLVTANPALTGQELAYVVRQSRARGIIVQPVFRGRNLLAIVDEIRSELQELREVISLDCWMDFVGGRLERDALPPVRPDQMAQIQFTSGTTGAPKGAMLTHRGLANNGRFYAQAIGADARDVWINPMPLFHTAGCVLATLGALQSGGTHVISPDADAGRLLQLFERERGSIMLSVPTMLVRMLNHPECATRDVSSWRISSLGGAPVAPELVRRAEQELGVQVVIGFGQTEASPYVTHTVPGDLHPEWIETVGPPLPQTEIRVTEPETGEVLPIGMIGEIEVRSYGVMLGYFENAAATAAALRPDGWLRTGDLGSIDACGYCRIQGRLKDMIIRGGENIYPREIEDVLFMHPGVANASVVGLPDPDWGEVVAAFVQGRPDAVLTEDALSAFCRERLASHKVPRIWRFLDEFPQTSSGKVKKFALRIQFLNAGATTQSTSP